MEKKINTKAKKEIILIFLSVFFISLVYALPLIPLLPDHFIGNVTINGQNAPVGTQINVYVDSTLEGSILTTIVGEYNLYVKTGNTGDLIEFKISDVLAGNSTRQGGKTINPNLSINTTTPSSSGSSGGSGGSGGGGSGGGSGRSIVSPSSSSNSEDTSSTNNSTNNETNPSEENKESQGVNLGITGGVIGSLGSGKVIIAVVFLIVLGIGVVLIKFKPLRKWTKRFS